MTSNSDDSRSFIGRWSERKRGHAVAPRTETTDETVAPLAGLSTPEPVELESTPVVIESRPVETQTAETSPTADDEPPLLSDADMPPIESLDASSDMSDFFNRGVSAALRRAALRQVFRSPVYNVRDGLNDYDGDYTVFEPLGDTVTSDMKFHAARKERERLEREAQLQDESANEQGEEAAGSGECEPEPQEAEGVVDEESVVATDEHSADPEASCSSDEMAAGSDVQARASDPEAADEKNSENVPV